MKSRNHWLLKWLCCTKRREDRDFPKVIIPGSRILQQGYCEHCDSRRPWFMKVILII